MKKPWKLYNTRKIIISYTLDVPATRQCSSSLQSSLQSSVAISHKNQHVLNTFFWLILSFLIFAAPSLTILHRGMFSAFTLLISSKIVLFSVSVPSFFEFFSCHKHPLHNLALQTAEKLKKKDLKLKKKENFGRN